MASTWRQILVGSIECNSHLEHSSYFQLATVTPEGKPANRTVVFRGFAEGTDKLQITTDIRTHKVEDIRHCPWGEICWYFTESWEQFRFHGNLDIIDDTNIDAAKRLLREKAWFSSSLKSRSQFLGPHPGFPLVAKNGDDVKQLDFSIGPVQNFCLLTLDPQQIDYYSRKTNSRTLFKKVGEYGSNGGQWTQEELNP